MDGSAWCFAYGFVLFFIYFGFEHLEMIKQSEECDYEHKQGRKTKSGDNRIEKSNRSVKRPDEQTSVTLGFIVEGK